MRKGETACHKQFLYSYIYLVHQNAVLCGYGLMHHHDVYYAMPLVNYGPIKPTLPNDQLNHGPGLFAQTIAIL